ncbi:MAG: hypothetical protein WCB51_09245 [Candidatus Dormiibacterota bacterium]
MSGVAERDQRVRGYLAELETALRDLPAPQATELMEQITAHLDEALPRGSSEETVAAVLRRLGSPAKLAGEARADAGLDESGAGAAAPTSVKRRLRNRFGRRGWGAIAVGVAVVCLLSTWLGLYLTTPSLTFGGSSKWLYPQDQSRAVDSFLLGAQATTVPARSGQWQGFVVQVENPSSAAQTVVGLATSTESPTGLVGMAGVTDVSVAVSTYGDYTGGYPGRLYFTSQQTIQPGQFRFIRVMWKTDPCSMASSGETGSDQLNLEVQVGWFSRVESLSLALAYQLQFGEDCPS